MPTRAPRCAAHTQSMGSFVFGNGKFHPRAGIPTFTCVRGELAQISHTHPESQARQNHHGQLFIFDNQGENLEYPGCPLPAEPWDQCGSPALSGARSGSQLAKLGKLSNSCSVNISLGFKLTFPCPCPSCSSFPASGYWDWVYLCKHCQKAAESPR